MRTATGQMPIARTGAAALLACSAVLFVSTGAAAGDEQLPGKLGSVLQKAQQVQNELKINDQQEQEIGAEVSQRIRQRYGVVQDEAVHRYVSLVGTVLAQASSRPNLSWKFIVLDTDGVNAFAAPGGYVHITRGALALITSEAELAGVLAHEISHVTEKHTLKAIKGDRAIQMLAARSNLSRNSELFRQIVDKTTEGLLAGYGREQELEADQKGVRLANSLGYAPAGLGDFLARLEERNSGSSGKQGLFASHPEMQERLQKLRAQISGERLASSATLGDRYHRFISYKPTAQADIVGVEAGASGLTGATTKTATKDQPKKKGFGLGGLLAPGSSEKKSAEVTGSAAARGVDKETGAKGGAVSTIVVVTLSPSDIAAFKKEGNLR